jgi:hypothetical protein
MGRIIMVVTVWLVMAAMMLAMAMPAFAEASPQGNCVGRSFSSAEPGTKGQIISAAATVIGGVGSIITIATKAPPEVPCEF